jgi:hypothetical protein
MVLKKGQVETMGLVMIVILLVIIGLFALKLSISNPNEDEFETEYLQLKANSLRDTIVESSVCSISVKDEIVNCRNNFTECFSNCEELKEHIFYIINSSLENNIEYKFEAKGEGYNMIIGKDCRNKISSTIQPIALTDVKVKIEVCRV